MRGAWDGDGRLVTIDSAGVLIAWDVARSEAVLRAQLWKGERPSFDLAADGKTVAVLADRAEVRLIDTRTGRPRRVLAVPQKPAALVRLTADGPGIARRAHG